MYVHTMTTHDPNSIDLALTRARGRLSESSCFSRDLRFNFSFRLVANERGGDDVNVDQLTCPSVALRNSRVSLFYWLIMCHHDDLLANLMKTLRWMRERLSKSLCLCAAHRARFPINAHGLYFGHIRKNRDVFEYKCQNSKCPDKRVGLATWTTGPRQWLNLVRIAMACF